MLRVSGKVRILCKEPLTIASDNLKITISRGIINVTCNTHKHSFTLFPTPIVGVNTRLNFRVLRAREYIVEAVSFSVSDEFSTSLHLTVCATDSITLTSRVKPIRRLIPLNLITPHLRVHLGDFTWHIESSLAPFSEVEPLEGGILPVGNANFLQFNSDSCAFSIFAGRCVLIMKNKLMLTYPKIYFRKHSNSLISLGLCYHNLPSQFEAHSSLTICHRNTRIETSINHSLKEESYFYDIDYNVADALEPIKVVTYQEITNNTMYTCALFRTFSDLIERLRPDSLKFSKITLIELIELLSSLVEKYPFILDEGMNLVERYLGRVTREIAISDQASRYIEAIIRKDEEIVANLARTIIEEVINKIEPRNIGHLFLLLEMLPLIIYPPSYITGDVLHEAMTCVEKTIPIFKQSILNDLGSKLVHLKFLALQACMGTLLVKQHFKVKNLVEDYTKELERTWNKLDESLKLISAGFSRITQFKHPKIFPSLTNFKVMCLPSLGQNTRIFLVIPNKIYESLRLYTLSVKAVKIQVLNELGELLYTTSEKPTLMGVVGVYLPITQGKYFILKANILP